MCVGCRLTLHSLTAESRRPLYHLLSPPPKAQCRGQLALMITVMEEGQQAIVWDCQPCTWSLPQKSLWPGLCIATSAWLHCVFVFWHFRHFLKFLFFLMCRQIAPQPQNIHHGLLARSCMNCVLESNIKICLKFALTWGSSATVATATFHFDCDTEATTKE